MRQRTNFAQIFSEAIRWFDPSPPSNETTKVSTEPQQPAPRRPLWHNRDFMLLWGGQVVSTFGSTATSIIYPLLILSLTDSPAAAGFAAALRAMPYLIFSLPVGALIDRWNRKRTMILCDISRAVAAISIALAL